MRRALREGGRAVVTQLTYEPTIRMRWDEMADINRRHNKPSRQGRSLKPAMQTAA